MFYSLIEQQILLQPKHETFKSVLIQVILNIQVILV